jgi:hypothetical protein
MSHNRLADKFFGGQVAQYPLRTIGIQVVITGSFLSGSFYLVLSVHLSFCPFVILFLLASTEELQVVELLGMSSW